MSNVNLINYSTREFTTKGEMDSYIRKQDEIFTEEVTKIFIEAGICSCLGLDEEKLKNVEAEILTNWNVILKSFLKRAAGAFGIRASK